MKVTREKLSPSKDDLLTEEDNVFFLITEIIESKFHLKLLIPKEVTKALDERGIVHKCKVFTIPETDGLMLKVLNASVEPKDNGAYIEFFEDPKSDTIIKKCIDIANETALNYSLPMKLKPRYYGTSRKLPSGINREKNG